MIIKVHLIIIRVQSSIIKVQLLIIKVQKQRDLANDLTLSHIITQKIIKVQH